VDEHRDFKFGTQVDCSNSQPMDDKPSLKGAWLPHMTHFRVLGTNSYLRNGSR